MTQSAQPVWRTMSSTCLTKQGWGHLEHLLLLTHARSPRVTVAAFKTLEVLTEVYNHRPLGS